MYFSVVIGISGLRDISEIWAKEEINNLSPDFQVGPLHVKQKNLPLI
jgi:hypothetical protein